MTPFTTTGFFPQILTTPPITLTCPFSPSDTPPEPMHRTLISFGESKRAKFLCVRQSFEQPHLSHRSAFYSTPF